MLPLTKAAKCETTTPRIQVKKVFCDETDKFYYHISISIFPGVNVVQGQTLLPKCIQQRRIS